jgi:diguanylate cyclase (GGDEF)-like protein
MSTPSPDILLEALADSGEPTLLVQVDVPDWPVVFSNLAFESAGRHCEPNEPLGELLDQLFGRELAADVSDAIRTRAESAFPVELGGRDVMLTLRMLGDGSVCAMYFRSGSRRPIADRDALLTAKRRILDLSREDGVTGLFNARAFRDIFLHDWAVASREKSTLSLIVIGIDDFEAYLKTFGRHAGDTCLKRVGQVLRRALRRASDVVAHLGDGMFVILSHASEEPGISDFSARLTDDIRGLSIHNPKSSVGKFVTASRAVHIVTPAEAGDGAEFLGNALV